MPLFSLSGASRGFLARTSDGSMSAKSLARLHAPNRAPGRSGRKWAQATPPSRPPGPSVESGPTVIQAALELRRPSGGLQLAQALAGVALAAAAFPADSLAMTAETAPPGFLEMLLEFIEGLGPLGPAAYTLLVCCCELIPLFPTQPLSLASGLLFGAQKGALCMCMGTTLAAAAAFAISRGVGKPLAEKVIEHELEELDGAAGNDGRGKNSLQSKFHAIEEAIEHGSFWKQAGAIFLLRLTPVVPFSASNYLLGLTPLPLAPYLAGTAVGMGCWSIVYASLGGASRSLLAKGVSADVLLADLLEKAADYTTEIAGAAVLAGVAVAGVYGAEAARKALASPQQQSMAVNKLTRGLLPEGKKQQLVEQEEY